jgi:hypothetical protein
MIFAIFPAVAKVNAKEGLSAESYALSVTSADELGTAIAMSAEPAVGWRASVAESTASLAGDSLAARRESTLLMKNAFMVSAASRLPVVMFPAALTSTGGSAAKALPSASFASCHSTLG